MVAFNRVVLSGKLAGGVERWSTSCAFIDEGGSPTSEPLTLQAWAEAIATALPTIVGAELKNGLGANGDIDEVRTYFYPSTSSIASAVGVAPAAVAGTLGISRPLVAAACISLDTNLAGRRRRGRMFWPALANTINNGGRFTGTVTANLAGQASTLLAGIGLDNPDASTFVPCVVSRAGDFVTTVTRVRVGDVPDTMRSRRDALDETYSVATI